MHVLYFHQYFASPSGSGGLRSYEFARRLLARGHSVTMVCATTNQHRLHLSGRASDSQQYGLVDGIEVVQLNLSYSNHLSLRRRAIIFARYALRAAMMALWHRCDLVFATSTPLTAGIPGIAARLLRGKPFVFEVRDLWPELPRAMGVVSNPFVLWGMGALEWTSYRAASACVALSPGIAKGIRRRAAPGQTIRMIPNGCDLELFRPGARAEQSLPGIRSADVVAVFTGAHGVANGLDAVLDAGAELLRRGRNDIVLALIGDGKCKPALVARARREGLVNCRFYEPMPKTALARVVNSADIGLMTLADVPAFYYGTSPNKFFDYIAAGLPVVNNYPGWLADTIREQSCGVAVPPRDAGALADALCHLADQPRVRREYGRNARRLAETEFSRRRLADEFVDLLEMVHAGKAWEEYEPVA